MQKTLDAILAGHREFQKKYTTYANIIDRRLQNDHSDLSYSDIENNH